MLLNYLKCTIISLSSLVVILCFAFYDITWLNTKPKSAVLYPESRTEHFYVDENEIDSDYSTKIYVITPTYSRLEQMAELIRLAQTLKHINNIFWIVVEDTQLQNEAVLDYLESTNMPYVYLTAQMPTKYRKKKNHQPRGVANRMTGLDYIKENVAKGVLYFADDDNTYDIRLFDDIRSTKKVSMFPVGLIGKYGVSSPIVKNGKITGFFDSWSGGRKFPVDMAGFAVNIEYLNQFPDAAMPYSVGYEEDGFLRSLNLSLEDIEPKALNCTKIWTWHTRTKEGRRPIAPTLPHIRRKIENSNVAEMLKDLAFIKI